MKKKSGLVLLLGPASLLFEGINSLLVNDSDYQVSTMNYSEAKLMLRDVDPIKPDIFLFCEATPVDREHTTELLHTILSRREAHAVVVRQDDNMISVYDKQVKPAHDLRSLLELLKGLSSGDCREPGAD